TNAAFLARVLGHPEFVAGGVDTGFIERHGEGLIQSVEPSAQVLELAAESFLPEGEGPWRRLVGFRMNAEPVREVRMRYEGRLVSAAPPSSVSPFGRSTFSHQGRRGAEAVSAPERPQALPFSPGGRRWPERSGGRMRGAPQAQA